MSLRHGREFLAIPGPTTVPDEVLSAMHRPAVDIYGGELVEVTRSCLEDLKKIFRASGRTLGVPHGRGGVQAAIDYFGRSVPS